MAKKPRAKNLFEIKTKPLVAMKSSAKGITVVERHEVSGPRFDTDRATIKLIDACVERAGKMAVKEGMAWDDDIAKELNMDLSACHCNGTPMDFAKLLAAEDHHFGHDVWGIRRFMDRETGKLLKNFSPRCHAAVQAEPTDHTEADYQDLRRNDALERN